MMPRVGAPHDAAIRVGTEPIGIGSLAPVDALQPLGDERREIGVDGATPAAEAAPTADVADQLCQHFGLRWTRHNPVWTPAALTHLRRLQRRFLEAALQLPAERRSVLLQATRLVEEQVQLRLRLEQMAAPLPDPSVDPVFTREAVAAPGLRLADSGRAG
ncbi:hypothetical protein AACH06_03990 [Ideonella sp. DXS29W]|uniref:Uncharacterized protein n=1 Tax=Ideonella lacteola TaxID=2984193 RepID=A0ABU9BJP4_9BURK